MKKLQIAWFSIALAFLLILVARSLPGENPISIVQFPGWSLVFSMFFTAEDNLTNGILSEIIYWIINVGLWGLVFFAVIYMINRLNQRANY